MEGVGLGLGGNRRGMEKERSRGMNRLFTITARNLLKDMADAIERGFIAFEPGMDHYVEVSADEARRLLRRYERLRQKEAEAAK